jgi:phage FluMu protein Com
MEANNLVETEVSSVLPEIDLVAGSTGITVHCPKLLKTARFVQYDVRGHCPQCKSSDLEVDYVLLETGINISTNRMKTTKFVPFDSPPVNYAGNGVIHIKNRRKRFSIPFKKVIINRPIKEKKVETKSIGDIVVEKLVEDGIEIY